MQRAYRVFAEVVDERTSDEPSLFDTCYFLSMQEALDFAKASCDVSASQEEKACCPCGIGLVGFYYDEGGIRFGVYIEAIEIETGRDISEVFQSLTIRVEIPREAVNHYICLPKDPIAWKEKMQKGIENVGQITMVVDTMAHGCDGASIGFFPEYGSGESYDVSGEGFGFVVNRETLTQMHRALQRALEEYK